MHPISLHITLSSSFVKNVVLHLVMYGAILFVAVLIAAFCTGLVLGRFWSGPTSRRLRSGELASELWRSEPPEAS
jgi:hypothetical protein